jgi:hypothetical protein
VRTPSPRLAPHPLSPHLLTGILVLTLAVDPRRLPAPLTVLPVPAAYVPLPPDSDDDAPHATPYDQRSPPRLAGPHAKPPPLPPPPFSPKGARSAAPQHAPGWGEPLIICGNERAPSPQLRPGAAAAKASYCSGAASGSGVGGGHLATHSELALPGAWDAEAGHHHPHAHARAAPAPGGCSSSGKGRPRRRGLVADIVWVLRIPTFQAIVLQVRCRAWLAGALGCSGRCWGPASGPGACWVGACFGGVPRQPEPQQWPQIRRRPIS